MRISDWSSDVCSSDLMHSLRAFLCRRAEIRFRGLIGIEKPLGYGERLLRGGAKRTLVRIEAGDEPVPHAAKYMQGNGRISLDAGRQRLHIFGPDRRSAVRRVGKEVVST